MDLCKGMNVTPRVSGQFWGTRCRGKKLLLGVSSSSFSWQVHLVLPLLSALRERKEVGKFAALAVEIPTSPQSMCLVFRREFGVTRMIRENAGLQ